MTADRKVFELACLVGRLTKRNQGLEARVRLLESLLETDLETETRIAQARELGRLEGANAALSTMNEIMDGMLNGLHTLS